MSRKPKPKTIRKLYFDACLFISRKKRDIPSEQLSGIDSLFAEIESGSVYALTGAVTIVELLDGSYEMLEQVFDGTKGELLDGTPPIMRAARDVRKKTRRKKADGGYEYLDLPDCIHVATASLCGCDLVTIDGLDGQIFTLLGLAPIIQREFDVRVITPISAAQQGAFDFQAESD